MSQDAAAGRLSQVINRWIYTACLVFGLDLADQQRTCFIYDYSVYQVEYSRNLLFRSGRQMEDVFDAAVDRTRSRLDVPQVITLFGAKETRPRTARGRRPPRLEVVIETPAYDLTKFKVHFGNLTLKRYTKGERVLRFEGIAHNTKDLRCGKALEKFAPIVTRLKQMVEEFCTALDCVDAGFIPDGLLDELPATCQLGSTRVGSIDVNKPRSRAVLAAALALAIAPGGFTVADFAAKVRAMTGQAGYHPQRRLRSPQASRQAPRRQTRPHPPLPHLSRRRPHHQRPAHPPGTRHRAPARRRRRPPDPPYSPPLDRHRPALPGAPPGDDGPVRRHRHRLRI